MKIKLKYMVYGFLVITAASFLVLAGWLLTGKNGAQLRGSAGSPDKSFSAVTVSQAPNIDGFANDAVWERAKPIDVVVTGDSGVEAKSVTLKAVRDEERLYLLATYKDNTPFKMGEMWRYDGEKWIAAPYDDTLAFVFNMNDSVKGFNTQGFGVMTESLSKGDDVFDFVIDQEQSTLVPKGTDEKADFWGW